MNTSCDLGSGCQESGVCYAIANGAPEQCPRIQTDAMRYRWLREGKGVTDDQGDGICVDKWESCSGRQLTGNELDAAIDAEWVRTRIDKAKL